MLETKQNYNCGVVLFWTLAVLREGDSEKVCFKSSFEEADGVGVTDGRWEGIPEPGSHSREGSVTDGGSFGVRGG